MSELLKFEGSSVLTAQNGSDALKQMRTAGHISLVLLDLWMPVMDGWEVLRRKRDDPGIAEIPVVVLSAVPPVSLDGADEALRKPRSRTLCRYSQTTQQMTIANDSARPLVEAHMMKGVSPTMLWNLAPKFDQCLRQSGRVTLNPWQQEIRDYVITAKNPPSLLKATFLNGASRRGLV